MRSVRNILSYRKKRRWRISLAVVLLCLPALAFAAQDAPPPTYIQFSIQDPGGNFFPQGEIEFCTPGGRCFYADIQEGFPGNFYLPSEYLHADTLYTVMIYDQQVKVLWEMRDWRFEPEDYDAQWNRWLGVHKFLIFPRFFVKEDGSMSFEVETTLNPEWERLMGLANAYAGPDTLPDFPELLWTTDGLVPLGGNFRSGPDKAAGVTGVSPGYGASLLRRFGYPQHELTRDSWASFREIGGGYARNRYDTDSAMAPGRASDVVLHRLWISVGYGRITQSMRTHWSVSLAAGHAAVRDGGKVLEYRGRSYRMWGGGVQVRWVRGLWSTDRADIGVIGRFDAMHWFADAAENDHWYGWEPSVLVGLVVY